MLCLVQFLLTFDDTAVNVAIPQLLTDLGFSTAGVAWVANAYFLTFGGLLLLGGRIGDLFGRRRVFLLGSPRSVWPAPRAAWRSRRASWWLGGSSRAPRQQL